MKDIGLYNPMRTTLLVLQNLLHNLQESLV